MIFVDGVYITDSAGTPSFRALGALVDRGGAARGLIPSENSDHPKR
jgi:hypothetical protein